MRIDFAKRMKELRTCHDLSLSEMASKIGITKSAVAQYEKGTSMPAILTALAIADYFDVSIDYLIGRTDNPRINR